MPESYRPSLSSRGTHAHKYQVSAEHQVTQRRCCVNVVLSALPGKATMITTVLPADKPIDLRLNSLLMDPVIIRGLELRNKEVPGF
jgi:hypothetical protein